MLREVEIEEYFKLSDVDRAEHLWPLVERLIAWKPSVPSKIREILSYAVDTKKFKQGKAAALELLSVLPGDAIYLCLMNIEKDEKFPNREASLGIIVEAMSLNYLISLDKRCYAIQYLLKKTLNSNSYDFLINTLCNCLSLLQEEMKTRTQDIYNQLRSLSKKTKEAQKIIDEELSWFVPTKEN